jgi:hypothetical protein
MVKDRKEERTDEMAGTETEDGKERNRISNQATADFECDFTGICLATRG